MTFTTVDQRYIKKLCRPWHELNNRADDEVGDIKCDPPEGPKYAEDKINCSLAPAANHREMKDVTNGKPHHRVQCDVRSETM